MEEGTSVTVEAADSTSRSFEDLYNSHRAELYRALATITNDRDLATEAVDVGFTRWRRKLRKPSGVAGAVGVMASAYSWARRQSTKASTQLSGFRLGGETVEADSSFLDRFKRLSIDDRALLVLPGVLGWSEDNVSHAIGAQGVGAARRSLLQRLESEGYGEDRLNNALRDHAATFSEPLSRLDAVKTKGTVQRAGAFLGGAAVSVAVVAGGIALAGNIGSAAPDAGGGSTTLAPANLGQGLTAENAVWTRIPAPVSGENIMAVTHNGTDFYMLAADNRGRPVMMQSSNGMDWAQIPGPPGGDNMWFQQIVATGDVLVAVGNGFDEQRGTETTLVFISEDGETWNRADLPFEDRIEIGGRILNLYTYVSSVDVGPNGFTVVGNQGAEFDPEEILRDVIDPELLRNGYGSSPNGMEFFDDRGNVVQSMTWEELGLDPALVEFINGSRTIVWTSADGIEWELSTETGPPSAHGIGAVAATAETEAVLAWGDFGPSVWVRNDGEWERPNLDASLTAMTSWNGQILAAGTDTKTGAPGLWRTTDGVTWDRSDIPVAGVQQFFTSESGIIATGYADAAVQAVGPAEIVVGDLTVLATSDGRFEVVDSDGTTVVEAFEEDVVRGSMITINDPNTGEVVVTFEETEFQQAWEEVYRSLEGGREGPPKINIMISQDGVNWTVLESEDPNFYPNSIAFGNNAVLMVGWSEGDAFLGFGGGGQQILLVEPG